MTERVKPDPAPPPKEPTRQPSQWPSREQIIKEDRDGFGQDGVIVEVKDTQPPPPPTEEK
jgi:hypothetical protein